MPTQKDLKRLVRARMTRTGEAYTAARANILRKPAAHVAAAPAPRQVKPDYAALAGMSDETIAEKTGSTWEKWIDILDREKATERTHTEVARMVRDKYKVPGWWAQSVTVGYERIKGIRERGQRRNGSYEATKSKTFNVPVEVLFDAWADARTRRKWLTGGSVKIRTATKPKSMRLDWSGGGIIAVGFLDKGKKSVVALSQDKLPDKATAERLKKYWSGQLDALGAVLVSKST